MSNNISLAGLFSGAKKSFKDREREQEEKRQEQAEKLAKQWRGKR